MYLILLFEYFKEVLIDIINNIKGGIIDFSIINNEVSSPLDHYNMFYMYIIPKRNNYSSNSNKTKGKWLQS
jgi:hypothetical protein